jgi:hypothetical protein
VPHRVSSTLDHGVSSPHGANTSQAIPAVPESTDRGLPNTPLPIKSRQRHQTLMRAVAEPASARYNHDPLSRLVTKVIIMTLHGMAGISGVRTALRRHSPMNKEDLCE